MQFPFPSFGKGQASVEYLLMQGVLFVIFAGVLFFVYTHYVDFENQSDILLGKQSAEKICTAVNAVSSFDEGTYRTISVDLPKGYDSNHSYARSGIVNLRIHGTDVNCLSNVSGNLPKSSGSYNMLLKRTRSGISISVK